MPNVRSDNRDLCLLLWRGGGQHGAQDHGHGRRLLGGGIPGKMLNAARSAAFIKAFMDKGRLSRS